MGSGGVLARPLPSVQVTWCLQAVPETPWGPGAGAGHQAALIATLHLPGPPFCLQGPSHLPAAGALAGSFPASGPAPSTPQQL